MQSEKSETKNLLQKKLSGQKITHILIVAFSALLILSLSVTGVCSYFITKANVKKDFINSSTEILNQTKKYIEVMNTTVDITYSQMYSDKDFMNLIGNINLEDNSGNDVISCMLKKGWYELVLKYMKKKEWDINHQNNEGDTFAHILVMKSYLDVMAIITELLKNSSFTPNLRNKKGETILDKSINNNYIYTTIKILEDERFNNIDLISFRNLYESYIKNNNYGIYAKMNNLEVIIDNLADKDLLPRMEKLISLISTNLETIKEEVENNKMKELDNLIYGLLEQSAV